MIKPEHKELKDFPISNKKSEGIHYIPADFDNITIRALYNIEYVKREIPLYLNILVPKNNLNLMKTIHCLFIFKEVLGENKMSSNILFPYQILQKKGL